MPDLFVTSIPHLVPRVELEIITPKQLDHDTVYASKYTRGEQGYSLIIQEGRLGLGESEGCSEQS